MRLPIPLTNTQGKHKVLGRVLIASIPPPLVSLHKCININTLSHPLLASSPLQRLEYIKLRDAETLPQQDALLRRLGLEKNLHDGPANLSGQSSWTSFLVPSSLCAARASSLSPHYSDPSPRTDLTSSQAYGVPGVVAPEVGGCEALDARRGRRSPGNRGRVLPGFRWLT
jgi:hypothetical protein